MNENKILILKKINKSACEKKIFYRTKKQAKSKAKKSKAKGGLSSWPYKCYNCGGYHLTSKKDLRLKVDMRKLK